MAARTMRDGGLRSAVWRYGALGVGLAVGLASVALADSYADRTAKVAAMTSEQKSELLRKKSRFDGLEEPERQRLRDLHAELEASPDCIALKKVMAHYCNWLRNLSARDRDEVLSLPLEDRIKRIKEIVSRQEAQRLRDYVTYYLPQADHEALYKFLDNFVKDHEREILDRLDENERQWFRHIDDDGARRKALIPKLTRRFRDARMPFPSIDEMRAMAGTLSQESQKQLDTQSGANRDDRVRELVWAAIGSIAMPPPSEEDLRKFFASLPSDEKGHLEEMDPEKMQQVLRYKYRMKQLGGWRGDGRPGPRGPRPGPPPGPPLGPPPPGFAIPK